MNSNLIDIDFPEYPDDPLFPRNPIFLDILKTIFDD